MHIKFFEVILILLSSIYIVNKFSNDLKSIVKITFILLIYIILFYVFGLTIYPSLYRLMGDTGSIRLGGGLINPNLLAYCLLIIAISTEFFTIKNYIKILIQIVVIYLIFLTVSRSAIIVLFGLIFHKFFRKKYIYLLPFFIMFFLWIIYYYDIVDTVTLSSKEEMT